MSSYEESEIPEDENLNPKNPSDSVLSRDGVNLRAMVGVGNTGEPALVPSNAVQGNADIGRIPGYNTSLQAVTAPNNNEGNDDRNTVHSNNETSGVNDVGTQQNDEGSIPSNSNFVSNVGVSSLSAAASGATGDNNVETNPQMLPQFQRGHYRKDPALSTISVQNKYPYLQAPQFYSNPILHQHQYQKMDGRSALANEYGYVRGADYSFKNTDNEASGQANSNPEGSDFEVSETNEDDDNVPVKLFVGQVPRTMDERDLTLLFEKYGEIKDILVIRDRHTGQHRGCAFVTFFSPDDAARVQDSLHDKFTFPGGRKPVQIKPASDPNHSENVSSEQENKLFIGMTSRNADENSIRELFSQFGEIREIYIIRNADGSNKGCAFLKFAENGSAINAIETLHEKHTMDGSTRPLIVKFADSKSHRKPRSFNGVSGYTGGHGSIGQGGMATSPGYFVSPGHHVSMYPNYQAPQVPSHLGMPPQYAQPPYAGAYPSVTPGSHPSPNYMYQHPSNPYYHASGPFGPGQGHAGSPVPSTASVEIYDGPPGGHRGAMGGRQHQARQQRHYHHRQEMNGAVNPRPREGPAGANLFIYHLPHDLTDADLATAFNPFGNVISAKVYVDKYTGESKGFGFVSYDSVISAEQAIEQMNGFQIGSKRLKVQHKRVSKPPHGHEDAGSENSHIPGTIVSLSQDSNTMIGGGGIDPHHQHSQPMQSQLEVDGLTGDLQNLDTHYTDDDD